MSRWEKRPPRDKYTSANWPPDEPTPDWVRLVTWLWMQDDENPRKDTIDLAWARLFTDDPDKRPPQSKIARFDDAGELIDYVDNPRWIERFDGGDAEFMVDAGGVVLLWSYPGNCAIGRSPMKTGSMK